MSKQAIFLIITALFLQLSSASLLAEYKINADSLKIHISVLAADSLEGRKIGEIGEAKANRYIQSIFRSIDLQPKGDTGSYLQEFDFIKGIFTVAKSNRLTMNNTDLFLSTEFEPMLYSGNYEFDFDEIVSVGYGIISDDSSYNDYAGKDVEGKAVIIKRYSPPYEEEDTDSTDSEEEEPVNPHAAPKPESEGDLDKYASLFNKVKTALDFGVTGIFFYTPPEHDDTILSMGGTRISPKEIPIIFLRRAGLEKLSLNLSDPEIRSLIGEVKLGRVRDTGYNVIGYLEGKSDSCVVIGAHYDHLGWGGPASLYAGKEKMIHNGADDNASGVGALLEIARHYYSHPGKLNYSLLFITFSGEESGLLGSSHYVRNWTVDKSKVRMMINMDMIGRLKEQESGLAVFGTGTCEPFKAYFDSLDTGEIKVVFKESGTGPSDHTAFYNDSIPVLHFFTGAHEDYHKPADDADKIDYEGIVSIASLVNQIIEHFDNYNSPLIFEKTKDEDEGKRRSAFSVTLGVMPDYISEAKGLAIDGVSPDRPADRAGVLKGDVVIKIGKYVIADIYDYMNVLGKFRKGDSTNLLIERDNDTINLPLVFE